MSSFPRHSSMMCRGNVLLRAFALASLCSCLLMGCIASVHTTGPEASKLEPARSVDTPVEKYEVMTIRVPNGDQGIPSDLSHACDEVAAKKGQIVSVSIVPTESSSGNGNEYLVLITYKTTAASPTE